MSKYKAVIFDLDGTILDTSPGIINGIDYMLPKMGLAPLTFEEKIKFIGPPLSYSYSNYLGLTGDDINKAIKIYREYCTNQGYKEFEHYPGMKELLHQLKEKNILTFIATNKKQVIADQTMQASGLDKELTKVLGNNDLESIKKSDLIQSLIDEYELTNDEVLMIGDTDLDAQGAYEAGVDFYPAMYGFGYSHSGYPDQFPYKDKLNSPMELLNLLD